MSRIKSLLEHYQYERSDDCLQRMVQQRIKEIEWEYYETFNEEEI